MIEYKGINCHVVWGNEDPEYFYISFGTYDYETDIKHDSYGVEDDSIFFYFDDNEKEALLKALTLGQILKNPTFSITDEWYIALPMGYELVEADF